VYVTSVCRDREITALVGSQDSYSLSKICQFYGFILFSLLLFNSYPSLCLVIPKPINCLDWILPLIYYICTKDSSAKESVWSVLVFSNKKAQEQDIQ